MSVFAELQRRNVIRIGLAYLAGTWLLIQVLETLFPIFGLAATSVRNVVIVLAIGFIPSMVFAWVFELTPDGLKRDAEVDRTAPASLRTGKQLDHVVMVMLALALGYFAFDKFVLDPERDLAMVEEAAVQARANALTESFGDHSIAVLAFSDMSPEGDQEYLSDGIAEELLNLLAKVPELRVISRSSAFSFKGKDADIPTLAKQLNVAHVLEGSVRKSGNRIRITAQLIEARSDTPIWSKTYNRTLGDIFAIQDDISSDVVDRLKVTLLAPVPKMRETDPEAYRLYLQGLYIANQSDFSRTAEAESLFRQALQLDPSFAPAWREMSRVLWRQIGSGPSLYDDIRRTRDALNRALEIDSDDAGTIAYGAWHAMDFDGDVARAAELFEHAIAVEPANENVIRTALAFSIAIGQSEDAIRIGEIGNARNPLCYWCNAKLADAYRNTSRLDEAERTIRESQTLFGGLDEPLGVVLLLKGQYQAASDSFRKIGNGSLQRIRIGMIDYDRLGPEEIAAFELLLESSAKILPWRVAEAYAWTGQNDAAFETINRIANSAWSGVEDDAVGWNRIRIAEDLRSPVFHPLGDDPRWQAVLERQGVSDEQLADVNFTVTLPE